MADLATQFPSSPSFQAVNFKLNTPSQVTETNSGKVRRTGYGVSYYSFDVNYPQLTALEAGTVTGFVAQTYGPQFSFEIILPELSYSKSTTPPSTIPAVAAADTGIGATNQIGAKVVKLTNCGANKRVLAAGDFFKFSNHNKVYMCVSPCDSNGSGAATLYFSGSLVSAITETSTTLTITAVPFTVILAEGLQEWDVGIGGMTSMKLSMREVW
jgi:hypothetical protein